MPMLVCAAQSCTYNDGMYCSKGDIQVGGEDANTVQETCCDSFRERTSNSATSEVGSPSATIDISCEAETCCYNEQCRCHAGQVSIAGAGAKSPEQTECGTFEMD